jgi:PadR family transcriptional regulator PadR
MFVRDVRLSRQLLEILAVMVEGREEDLHGRLIGKRAGVSSGTLFPALARLESAGWISSHEEDGDPVKLGRPRQRIYKLTGQGETAAREEIAKLATVLNRALDAEPFPPRIRRAPAQGLI